MNDTERAQWVENDEALYIMRKESKLSLTKFVRENRKLLDEYIARVLAPRGDRR